MLSGSGVSWCQFPLQGKPLKGSYFQAEQLWRTASSRGSGFDATALSGAKAGSCEGICNDDSTLQTSPRWPGEASYVQRLAEHPLFTLQGVVPSLSCSGVWKNSPAASWLFLISPPAPFTYTS